MSDLPIQSALLSVYHKEGLEPVALRLHQLGVQLISTGGTQKYLEGLGLPVTAVESLTGYPDIFGGRVKTLHPVVFGGILFRRENEADVQQAQGLGIAGIDLVVVDLYPFAETVAAGGTEEEIIEKIDIGGIALIRAAAKNAASTTIVSHRSQYARLLQLLQQGATIAASEKKQFAREAFALTSSYDAAIAQWLAGPSAATALRYGENPHQKAVFYGDLSACFNQLHGKALSYNNLVDADAALQLIREFQLDGEGPACVIIKHTNACGAALGASALQAYQRALAADPVSAFGGVIALNTAVDEALARELDSLFFEILIAPAFEPAALAILQKKKNRILLEDKGIAPQAVTSKTLLNGTLQQDADLHTETAADLQVVTKAQPSPADVANLLFAAKVCKHTKSNAIVLARDGQLLASGTGQTSRVDALRQAIAKAQAFGFNLQGAAMASDAFFPFPDCVEIAHSAGITAIVQPGGSLRDQDSTDVANQHGIAMVHTGYRHFRH